MPLPTRERGECLIVRTWGVDGGKGMCEYATVCCRHHSSHAPCILLGVDLMSAQSQLVQRS